ncbi:MAG: hypothetical protein ACLU80_13595 [Dorea sp.]
MEAAASQRCQDRFETCRFKPDGQLAAESGPGGEGLIKECSSLASMRQVKVGLYCPQKTVGVKHRYTNTSGTKIAQSDT